VKKRFALGILLVSAILSSAANQPIVRAQANSTANAAAAPPALSIGGDVPKPLSLSMDDLKRLPRKTIHVMNEHAEKDEVYEGVPLSALLKQAGAPQGGQIRGNTMATYVLAEGSDNYQVIFSIEELDADFQNSEVLVADTVDGAPLADKIGPLRLVVPQDKRPVRWVRMLRSIQVVKVSK
jgi:DMSO/TMAO reductase YedYZ molybdopterin-dependent catalytic subunit